MKHRNKAVCHHEKENYARGLCRSCYNKEPDIKKYNAALRKTEKHRARIQKYEKGPVKAASFRRSRHGFTPTDEIRFLSLQNCDWCGFPFEGELPRIDHDKRCCNNKTGRHCKQCTRGFVHHLCNSGAIAHAEWIERKFGLTSGELSAYRERFPVPRRVVCD
jgi:hypothetical protein